MNIYGKAARDVGAVRKWIIKINDRPKDGDGQCVLGKKRNHTVRFYIQ